MLLSKLKLSCEADKLARLVFSLFITPLIKSLIISAMSYALSFIKNLGSSFCYVDDKNFKTKPKRESNSKQTGRESVALQNKTTTKHSSNLLST
ncbi:MAG: hypothetical protein AAJB65_00380 [Candidatus Hodgkinia cicadicola]